LFYEKRLSQAEKWTSVSPCLKGGGGGGSGLLLGSLSPCLGPALGFGFDITVAVALVPGAYMSPLFSST